jgi:hypothetical protein
MAIEPSTTNPGRNQMQTKSMEDRNISRRNWLESLGQGFGGLVLGAMLDRDKAGASPLGDQAAGNGLGSGGSLSALHHRPKAKRVVQLFMAGAASHLDLFDFKEDLVKQGGPMVSLPPVLAPFGPKLARGGQPRIS